MHKSQFAAIRACSVLVGRKLMPPTKGAVPCWGERPRMDGDVSCWGERPRMDGDVLCCRCLATLFNKQLPDFFA